MIDGRTGKSLAIDLTHSAGLPHIDMRIKELKVTGAWMLEGPLFVDKRGVFEEIWDDKKFCKAGIEFKPSSACQSYNCKAGTLRGMHFQKPPHAQAKVVSCVTGAIWDVVVDLRRESPSYLHWDAVNLFASSGTAVYVPRGCAHGFLTLRDHSTVSYLIDGAYRPDAACILRWNDPIIGIIWGNLDPILSEQDRFVPDYEP